jgi:hypothetical protein
MSSSTMIDFNMTPNDMSHCNSEDLQAYYVQPITFLPGLPTSYKILNGEPITFNSHLKEIMKYYDILPVSRSLLGGMQLP